MSHIHNDIILDSIREQREIWLMQNLCTEQDVREDAHGEFIWWTEYDGETGAREKIYLPKEITSKALN